MRRGRKSPNDFKFGILIGRFPSDGAKSTAVKGLKDGCGTEDSGENPKKMLLIC